MNQQEKSNKKPILALLIIILTLASLAFFANYIIAIYFSFCWPNNYCLVLLIIALMIPNLLLIIFSVQSIIAIIKKDDNDYCNEKAKEAFDAYISKSQIKDDH